MKNLIVTSICAIVITSCASVGQRSPAEIGTIPPQPPEKTEASSNREFWRPDFSKAPRVLQHYYATSNEGKDTWGSYGLNDFSFKEAYYRNGSTMWIQPDGTMPKIGNSSWSSFLWWNYNYHKKPIVSWLQGGGVYSTLIIAEENEVVVAQEILDWPDVSKNGVVSDRYSIPAEANSPYKTFLGDKVKETKHEARELCYIQDEKVVCHQDAVPDSFLAMKDVQYALTARSGRTTCVIGKQSFSCAGDLTTNSEKTAPMLNAEITSAYIHIGNFSDSICVTTVDGKLHAFYGAAQQASHAGSYMGSVSIKNVYAADCFGDTAYLQMKKNGPVKVVKLKST